MTDIRQRARISPQQLSSLPAEIQVDFTVLPDVTGALDAQFALRQPSRVCFDGEHSLTEAIRQLPISAGHEKRVSVRFRMRWTAAPIATGVVIRIVVDPASALGRDHVEFVVAGPGLTRLARPIRMAPTAPIPRARTASTGLVTYRGSK